MPSRVSATAAALPAAVRAQPADVFDRRGLAVLGALALVVVAVALGRTAVAGEEAAEPLNRMQRALGALETFEVAVTLDAHFEARGRDQTLEGEFTVAGQRPDRFALRHENPRLGGAVVGDGRTVWLFHPQLGAYTETEGAFDAASLRDTEDFYAVLGQASLVLPFLLPDAGPESPRLENPRDLQSEAVDGRDALRIRLDLVMPSDGAESTRIPADLWIASEGKPWPLRFEPDFAAFFEAARQRGQRVPEMSMRMVFGFQGWRESVKDPDVAFGFHPPDGAERVEALADAASGSQGPGGGSGSGAGLEGAAAPEIDLEVFEGGRFRLSEASEEVVVLDFWASWCGPCVRAMPEIESVRDWAREEGLSVAVYAVNLREDDQTIGDFLEKHQIDLRVLKDRQGAVAGRYGVRGIPMTVVIADGRVAEVHTGFHPELAGRLKGQIRAALASGG